MPILVYSKEDLKRALEQADLEDPESLENLCRLLVRLNYYGERVGEALRVREYPFAIDMLTDECKNAKRDFELALEFIEVLRAAQYAKAKEKLEARRSMGKAEDMFKRFTDAELKNYPNKY